ncbi:hypothetical protein UFOVP568_10 [uncultured Caudovirales phage]|uniref:Uncharacterized protein n=1 Tax=uncultured Caudovirales phage TaxID=2100421 RepID=A0A6J5N380_9CAUD|nr:hypothetical protein UFOVP568_10 [uncultured Caudovirales phage]
MTQDKQPKLRSQFEGSVLSYTDCYAALLRYNMENHDFSLPNGDAVHIAACKALNALSTLRIQFGKTQRG